jgi:glycosyltransferase involved in cell wall biosynthesis
LSQTLSSLKVAIVHEWLVVHAGAERVLDELLAVFPQAELHALIAAMPGEPPRTYRGRPVKTSFVQSLPGGITQYRRWLPVFPRAIESFDFSAYDLVLSSSYCVAKGAITSDKQLHVSYCYSPVRYAWDLREQYLAEAGFTGARAVGARWLLERLRSLDLRTTDRVDEFLTLSHHIADRIKRCYGRESTVVHPPVDLQAFTLSTSARRGFISVSRLVPYKLAPMLVRAFATMPDQPFTLIGDGPDLAACRRAAEGHPHIRIFGHQPESVVREELARAEAFVFAALEDFGIAPLEAQAVGTPVLAYGAGGARETVIDGKTGLFFDAQTEDAVRDIVRRFRSHIAFDPVACRANAEQFSSARFRAGISTAIEKAWTTRGLVGAAGTERAR